MYSHNREFERLYIKFQVFVELCKRMYRSDQISTSSYSVCSVLFHFKIKVDRFFLYIFFFKQNYGMRFWTLL